MSLIYFHIGLISCAIIFAGGFGFWEWNAFIVSGRPADLAASAGSYLTGIFLAVYLIWFIRRKIGR